MIKEKEINAMKKCLDLLICRWVAYVTKKGWVNDLVDDYVVHNYVKNGMYKSKNILDALQHSERTNVFRFIPGEVLKCFAT